MPNFNSREFEFADIKVMILGVLLGGLRGITYKISQEKELIYGAGNSPKSIQRGNKKTEGNLTVLQSDFHALDAAAKAKGYDSITDVPGKDIDITVVYDKGNGEPLKTDKLINVEFTDAEDGMKQGDKMKEVELPFIFLRRK